MLNLCFLVIKLIASQNNLFPELNTKTIRSYNELVIRWPKNIILESNLTYRFNSTSDQTILNHYVLWNGGITYLFLKENKGQLKVSLYDILNQNISISRYITENYITDSRVNIQKQYLMVTFFYDIRGVQKNNIGKSNRLLLF